jgi:site-specific recombinase XerD
MSYAEGMSIMLSPSVSTDRDGSQELTASQLLLEQMMLNPVTAANTLRNYSKSLDDLFAFSAGRPLTRALLQEWKSSMDGLAASTVNVKLAAARRLVSEARRNGLIDAEEASNLSDIPNVAERGNRLGNWLTRERAKDLLRVPDRSTLKGKRDCDPGSAGRLRATPS